MRTLSREFFSMTTSTRSVSWSGGINPLCAVCCVNLHERTPLSRTIWRSRPSFAPIRTSVVFAVKRAFPPGFTGSRTTVFEKMRVAAGNLWESMKNNSKHNTIPRRLILL